MSLLTQFTSLLLLTASLGAYAQTPQDWRQLDPDNTLLITTTQGKLYIEMRPEIAPKAVERIKKLTREKIYDGLQFHRVIPQFVAQTGNPNNKDGGGTSYPNLPPEMVFRLPKSSLSNIASDASDSASGFIGSVPFQSLPLTSLSTQKNASAATLRSWGAHCASTAGMGRNEPRDSANSELYFMLAATRRLDRDYTLFGRVVIGFDVLLKLAHGEPPTQPDLMQTVQLLSDIPADKRPAVSVASSAKMQELIDKTRQEKGADFSVCDVPVPAKLD